MAGTVGGATFGVAKAIKIWSVRVLDSNNAGTAANLIAAVNWLTQYHRKPAVANVSIGTPLNYSLNTAMTNSFNAGVTYTVSAGNDNRDACQCSPKLRRHRECGPLF